MNVKIKIPEDIRRYCRKKLMKSVIPCVLLLAVMLTAIILHESSLTAEDKEGKRILLYMVMLAIPLAISKLPYKQQDRTWTGTVEDAWLEEKSEKKPALKQPLKTEELFKRISVMLDVKLDNGKKIRIEAIRDLEKYERGIKGPRYAYKPGQRVLHVAGTDYIQIVPDENRTAINCIVCGDNNPKENEKCHACGHSLHFGEKK